MDFNRFLALFRPDKQFDNRLGATKREWERCPPDKQQAIIAWLEIHGRYPKRNPYFFIQDFKTQPTFLRGDEKGLDLVQVRYNGLIKICTRETQQTFGLEHFRDWSPSAD